MRGEQRIADGRDDPRIGAGGGGEFDGDRFARDGFDGPLDGLLDHVGRESRLGDLGGRTFGPCFVEHGHDRELRTDEGGEGEREARGRQSGDRQRSS